ncbi:MAG: hypothetical protein LBC17_02120 [Lactobacillaceae bacterium]|jgi:hypothetical protein|nr:hypothetical protein [Lactobacillaceae bacterium]
MNILFNDLIPYSDAPDDIKNPSLTYFINNEPAIYDLLDGGPADAIYDLLDGENAATPSDGDIDGGGANATFDDEFDGGIAIYISDEIDGGHANDYYDETWDGGTSISTKEFEIKLHEPSTINCYGAGNTDSKLVGIYLIDTSDNIYYEAHEFTRNGLYMLEKEYENIKQINLVFSGTHIGRVGTGYAINLRTSVPKEPTLVSTAKPRVTLSGQSILGLGGYNYWRISVDTRYKIDKDKLNSIIEGYKLLSKGYPMFISFDDEKKLPIDRMYGNDKNQQELSFESSINKPLFSRRFILEERF